MVSRIIHSLQAKQDIQDAVYWYNEEQKGLGEKFLSELKIYLQIIPSKPKAFAIRFDDIRCLPLKKFPFLIYYRYEESIDTIFIEAIFNTNLNPKNWQRNT